MENLYHQPGLYAFATPQNLPPMLELKAKIVPKGLIWNSRQMGRIDRATRLKIAEMNRLKKELGL